MNQVARLFGQLVIVFLIASNVHAQVGIDEVVFDKEIHDFGTVKFGTKKIKATYIFTNNSAYDFEIKKVIASCGCTVPSWPNKPIRPGMKGVITAVFDPTNLAGEVDKDIEILANYNDAMSKVLRIQGIVNKPRLQDMPRYVPGQLGYLRMSQEVLGFGKVKNSQSYTKQVQIINDYNRSLTITGVEKAPDYVDVQFEKMEVESGDTINVTITVDASKIDDYGLVNAKVLIATRDIYYRTKLVNLAMDVEHDFGKLKKKTLKAKPTIEFSAKTFDAGTLKEGSKKNIQVTIRNTGKSPLSILKIKSDCSCTLLSGIDKDIGPGETVTGKITFDSIYQNGMVEKEIILYTNDPTNHKIILVVYAQVSEN